MNLENTLESELIRFTQQLYIRIPNFQHYIVLTISDIFCGTPKQTNCCLFLNGCSPLFAFFRLQQCKLREDCCTDLTSVLISDSSQLKFLDLSNNSLTDYGVSLLIDGLRSPNCGLESLRSVGTHENK